MFFMSFLSVYAVGSSVMVCRVVRRHGEREPRSRRFAEYRSLDDRFLLSDAPVGLCRGSFCLL